MTDRVPRGEFLVILACMVLFAGGQVGAIPELGWFPLTAIIVVAFYLLAPLVSLVHELGHAVVAVRLTGRPARVQIGDDESALHVVVGRIDVWVNPRGGQPFCVFQTAGASPRDHALISLAGPAASALCVALLAAAAVSLHDGPALVLGLAVLGAAIALNGMLTAVPHSDELGPNDGASALEMIRRHRGTAAWRAPLGP
jgi:hypothetical protein